MVRIMGKPYGKLIRVGFAADKRLAKVARERFILAPPVEYPMTQWKEIELMGRREG